MPKSLKTEGTRKYKRGGCRGLEIGHLIKKENVEMEQRGKEADYRKDRKTV